MTRIRLRVVSAMAAAMMAFGAAPVQAGQVELDLLTSYVGNWSGKGVLVGEDARAVMAAEPRNPTSSAA